MKTCTYLLFAFLVLVSGCYPAGSFKVARYPMHRSQSLQTIQYTARNPYVVVHTGDSAWEFNSYTLNSNNTAIKGTINKLPAERYSYRSVQPAKLNIAPDSNRYPFDELHIYTTGITFDATGPFELPDSAIKEVQVYNRMDNKNAQNAAGPLAVGTAATVTGIIAVVAIVIAVVAAISVLIVGIFLGDVW